MLKSIGSQSEEDYLAFPPLVLDVLTRMLIHVVCGEE
jgi:hypothetical protein